MRQNASAGGTDESADATFVKTNFRFLHKSTIFMQNNFLETLRCATSVLDTFPINLSKTLIPTTLNDVAAKRAIIFFRAMFSILFQNKSLTFLHFTFLPHAVPG